jgi:hypothetical protein
MPFTRCRDAVFAAVLVIGLVAVAACSGSSTPGADATGSTTPAPVTQAQLAEARRLLDPDREPSTPTDTEVACVARVVVLNPNVDQIANDMAQIQDADLRELVMTDYLGCAYNYVLNVYMRFAPSNLTAAQKTCVRKQFTLLTVKRLSEVMVLDPDAGYTGPLVIQACKTGSAKVDPLAHGTIPNMGGS